MKNSTLILILFTLLAVISCREDLEFEPSKGTELRFSKDTIYLDTIFTKTSSSTYTLKVYNTSKKNIKIPKIHLKKGQQSHFRISVDGIAGKSFENIELLAKDSLFIFIESTVDIKQHSSEKEFLYTDQIQFQTGNHTQEVELVSLIKDAHFLYPQKYNNNYESIPFGDEQIYGFFLDENDAINGNELQWTNDKPYVIYGYAAVPPNKTLHIAQGTEVHFHANSGLMIYPNAHLQAEGSIEKPIIFQGDRLEPSYENTPGQWDMIFFVQNSTGNIKNAIIKNATIGLFINTQAHPIEIENIQVYNCSNYGIVGRAAKIIGKNIVTNNIGKSALALNFGGTYDFTHCTFANFWNRAGHNALNMDNYDGSTEFALNATFKNSIIYSNAPESIKMLASENNSNFNYTFQHCLIKFHDHSQILFNKYPYLFNDSSKFNQCLISRSNNEYPPHFINTSKNQMEINQNATSIIGYGNPNFASIVPYDLKGNPRTNSPDLGAYQHQIITNQ